MIHGYPQKSYPQKSCGYGWDISYPRQACLLPKLAYCTIDLVAVLLLSQID